MGMMEAAVSFFIHCCCLSRKNWQKREGWKMQRANGMLGILLIFLKTEAKIMPLRHTPTTKPQVH